MSSKKPNRRGQSGHPARAEVQRLERDLRNLDQIHARAARLTRSDQGVPVTTPTTPGPGQAPPAGISVEAVAAGLQQKLNELVQQNVASMQGLAARGIRFDPNQIVNARIDSMIDSIAQALGPQGVLWGLQCRLLFESRMAENCENAKSEGTKAMIAQAGSFSPEAIREMAKATGTFGGR